MVSNRPLPDCVVLGRYASTSGQVEHPPTQRGRPRTRTHAHYIALHAEYLQLALWFVERKGRPHKSDTELLQAYFGERYEAEGLRRSRVTESCLAGKIKTLRNELSRARAMHRS